MTTVCILCTVCLIDKFVGAMLTMEKDNENEDGKRY